MHLLLGAALQSFATEEQAAKGFTAAELAQLVRIIQDTP
jgi:hypothetical protein